MNQQWQNLLQNLGEWRGSFTRFSPDGAEQDSLPTIVTLRGLPEGAIENAKVRITVDYLTQPDRSVDKTFSNLGRDVLFHENGAFAQGSMQVSPVGTFGAELGMREGERRLRLVQLFKDRTLQTLTLIREALPDATTPERSPLAPKHLQGTWWGQAVCLYADFRSPQIYNVTREIYQQNDRLTIATQTNTESIATTFIQTGIHRWIDPQSPGENQLIFLPDGGLSLSPQALPLNQAFCLELAWQISPHQRYRLRREYDQRGTWVSLTWIREERLE